MFVLSAAPGRAAERLAGPIPAALERVVDGDTVAVRARIWLDQELSVKVRLAGVDAPELYRPACEAERALAEQASALVAREATGELTLTEIGYGKYAGRVVARVRTASGRDLADMLLASGLAVPDSERRDWCAAPGS